MTELFGADLGVVNVGLASFARNLAGAGAEVVDVAWRPPAAGDVATGLALAALVADPMVEEANRVAFGRYLEATPVLADVVRAADAIDALRGERRILHAGPPIAWADMCGPMQGAIVGAILHEGWASTPDTASALAASGAVAFEPNHHHGAVGPMAGVVGPSMPVWVVENTAAGNRTYCNFNEGLGKVLRFGANGRDVLDRLAWMGTELFSLLQQAVRARGPIELKPLVAQALHMGDETHNRNAAATGLFLKRLLPALVEVDAPSGALGRVVEYATGNDHLFLNVSMASCKAMLDAASGVPHSSMVTG